jgi:hypothetical protein
MLPLKRELKIALVVLLGSLFFSAKAQAGVTFGAKVIVQDAGGSLADFPSVAVDISGNIYVVWQDTRGGVGDIYFAKSTDGGATFNPNVRVNDADTDSAQFEPDMAVDTNGNIYVVWTDTRNGYCDTYFAKSTDGGATFSPNVRVNDTSSPTGGNYSKIAVDTNGNIYVVWADGRNGNLDIYFAKSTDGGATFSPNVRVDDTGALNKTQYLPCLALDSQGNIYVAWKDERSGHHDIYFAKSTDGGATFSPNVRVNFVGSDGHWPAIAVDNHGNIFVAWQDSSSSSGIYLAKSVDGGISFGTNVKVNDGPMGSTVNSPSMVVDRNGAVYIVWEDNRDRQLSGGSDIYFARSRNGGASFETNIHVDETSLSTPYQTLADISIDNNANIYVVWQESRIYSVKGIQTDSSQPLPYLQNFSTDPGWATNNAANFSWNQQEGNYSAKSIIGSGEYAIVETDYNGGDFRIEFDLKITNRDTDSQTIFGLFGPTYTGYQTSPYDKPCLYVSVGGSEKKFKLVGITDTGNYYSSESQANALKTNTWYRLSLLYDSANKRIGLKVREKGKEPWENWVCGPEVSNLVGSFPLEMKYLGFSMVGEWATSGPMQEALIDNLKFVLTGGISGKATREDGITPIANVDFNLNTYTDFSSYYDRFWSQSLADGTYYISCLEAGDYRMDAQPPYGFGPEYYNNTESWSGASPVHVETGVTTPNIDFTLPLGGEIRGHVYAKDGITPVAG